MRDFHLDYRCERCGGQRLAIQRDGLSAEAHTLFFCCLVCELDGLHECPTCGYLTTEEVICIECFAGRDIRQSIAAEEAMIDYSFLNEM